MDDNYAVEITANTVDEAVANALQQLDAQPHEVVVEVLEEPSRGLLGVGAKPARVMVKRLAPPSARPEPESEPEELIQDEQAGSRNRTYSSEVAPAVDDSELSEEGKIARDVLHELLLKMGVDVQITVRQSQPGDDADASPLLLDISSDDDVSRLIGPRGTTLSALQYITRLIVSRHTQQRTDVVIDVDGYKSRRSDKLRALAHRMADQVVQQGRSVTLEPMPPNERRIIHLALRNREDVDTHSVGEGSSRKVVIDPR